MGGSSCSWEDPAVFAELAARMQAWPKVAHVQLGGVVLGREDADLPAVLQREVQREVVQEHALAAARDAGPD